MLVGDVLDKVGQFVGASNGSSLYAFELYGPDATTGTSSCSGVALDNSLSLDDAGVADGSTVCLVPASGGTAPGGTPPAMPGM